MTRNELWQQWGKAELARRREERMITGYDMKRIRRICGYSAREFAEYLQRYGARITTSRSIYRIESEPTVTRRYINALRDFVGHSEFDRAMNQIIIDEEYRRLENIRLLQEREQRRAAREALSSDGRTI